jgi:hypothetical protein
MAAHVAIRIMLVNNKYAVRTLLRMVLQLINKITFVFLAMTVLIVSCQTVKASDSGTVSFTYGYIWGVLEFPEEVHPSATVTCNLTLGAYLDVTINNFTLGISGLVGQSWQLLHAEHILSRHLAQGENFSTSVLAVLPKNTSASLHYTVEASTDKGFGETAFYATYVRSSTYGELSNAYDELQNNYSQLQQNYSQLFGSYVNLNLTLQSLTSQYNSLQTACYSLNSSYASLNINYSSLNSDYNSLQQNYEYIKEKYDSSLAELGIIRNLMFGFGIATVILAATTLYFRKKAPYIVVRKETEVKPANQQ